MRMAAIDQQADGDQRRQRVADHVQPQGFVPGVRQDRQLEGQAGNVLPGDQPGQAHSSSGWERRRCDRRRTRGGGPRRSPRGESPAAQGEISAGLLRDRRPEAQRMPRPGGRARRPGSRRRRPAAWWPGCWDCRWCRPSRRRRSDVSASQAMPAARATIAGRVARGRRPRPRRSRPWPSTGPKKKAALPKNRPGASAARAVAHRTHGLSQRISHVDRAAAIGRACRGRRAARSSPRPPMIPGKQRFHCAIWP